MFVADLWKFWKYRFAKQGVPAIPIERVLNVSARLQRLELSAIDRADRPWRTESAFLINGATIRVINIRNGEEIARIGAGKETLVEIEYSVNGQFLFGSSESGRRFIWQAEAAYKEIPWRFESPAKLERGKTRQGRKSTTGSINKKAI